MAKQLALFGLMTALWSLNWFPVQRAEKILVATAVVSGQRLPSLQGLSKQVRVSSDAIRWVHYSRDSRNSTSEGAVDRIEHIYLRLGVVSGASYEQIQRELIRLTEPSPESLQVPRDLSQLRAERWKLATIEHQMALFELDRTRERNSQGSALNEDESSQVERSSTKASAVVYRKLTSETPTEPPSPMTQGAAWESLQNRFDQSAKRIEALESELAQQRLEESGTIAITGSPRMGVMSTRASVPESLCVLAFSTLSCLGLAFCLRKPVPARLARPRGMDATAMLSQMGLPHLGSIPIMVPTEPSINAAIDIASRDGVFPATQTGRLSDLTRIWLTRRIVDGLLVVWVGLFAFRFLSDANWRELLFSTPLSAFSSMLLGTY